MPICRFTETAKHARNVPEVPTRIHTNSSHREKISFTRLPATAHALPRASEKQEHENSRSSRNACLSDFRCQMSWHSWQRGLEAKISVICSDFGGININLDGFRGANMFRLLNLSEHYNRHTKGCQNALIALALSIIKKGLRTIYCPQSRISELGFTALYFDNTFLSLLLQTHYASTFFLT